MNVRAFFARDGTSSYRITRQNSWPALPVIENPWGWDSINCRDATGRIHDSGHAHLGHEPLPGCMGNGRRSSVVEMIAHREQLQYVLNEFMAIDQESFGAAELKKKSDAP